MYGLFQSLTGGGGLSASLPTSSSADPFVHAASPKTFNLASPGLTTTQIALMAGAAVLVALIVFKGR